MIEAVLFDLSKEGSQLAATVVQEKRLALILD